MKRERMEQRLFRIFAGAGYTPEDMLTITPEEMVEIPGITVPNIRAVLYVQNRIRTDQRRKYAEKLVDMLLAEDQGKQVEP